MVMSIFGDIHDADKELGRTFDDRYRAEFVKGFKAGYNSLKRLEVLQGVAVNQLQMVIKYRVNSNEPTEIRSFATGLGEIIALLRFHPLWILDNLLTTTVVDIITKLVADKSKEKYYNFIKTRMLRWYEKVKNEKSSLDNQQLNNFNRVVKSL